MNREQRQICRPSDWGSHYILTLTVDLSHSRLINFFCCVTSLQWVINKWNLIQTNSVLLLTHYLSSVCVTASEGGFAHFFLQRFVTHTWDLSCVQTCTEVWTFSWNSQEMLNVMWTFSGTYTACPLVACPSNVRVNACHDEQRSHTWRGSWWRCQVRKTMRFESFWW